MWQKYWLELEVARSDWATATCESVCTCSITNHWCFHNPSSIIDLINSFGLIVRCIHLSDTFPCIVKTSAAQCVIRFFSGLLKSFLGVLQSTRFFSSIQDSAPWKRRALLQVLSPERNEGAFWVSWLLIIKGHSLRLYMWSHCVEVAGEKVLWETEEERFLSSGSEKIRA